MDSKELEALLEECGALLSGHFKLSSGKHSNRYVQNALLLQHPAKAGLVGAAIGRLWESETFDLVVAPAMGGLIIGHEVARYLGTPFLFTERQDGTMTLRRGLTIPPGARVLITEDVVTTGKSLLEVAEVVRQHEGVPVGATAIIDRMEHDDFGIPLRTLLNVEAEVWDPDDCPLCRDGVPITRPGSRPE